jgi:chemotaxis protein MotB
MAKANDKKSVIIVKRIEGGGHGHHGGAWKVAYADFVTAMMCFFLVMWLMGSDEEIKSSVEEFFNNPNSEMQVDSNAQNNKYVGGNTGDGDSILKGMDGMMADDLVRSPKVPFAAPVDPRPDYAQDLKQVSDTVRVTENLALENMQFVIPEDFLFKPGSFDFRDQAFDYLKYLGRIAERHEGRLQIEGYTTPLPAATEDKKVAYEFALSRVVSVMAWLTKSRKMEEGRIRPVVSSGLGNPVSRDRVIRFTFTKDQG